jgi:hypothetical protein
MKSINEKGASPRFFRTHKLPLFKNLQISTPLDKLKGIWHIDLKGIHV